MPHAKKELNPLWALLTGVSLIPEIYGEACTDPNVEPLGQILAAVGLLLAGVLGLVGKLVSSPRDIQTP